MNFFLKWLTQFMLIVFFLLFCSLSKNKNENISVQLTNKNGLVNNSVNCILQDSSNNMWFGTWDGLSFFDGRNFKNYRFNNTENSLSNNIIRQIIEYDSSSIWISTDYGINLLDINSQSFKHYFPHGENWLPPIENSYVIRKTNNNLLLCLVKGIGLFYFDKQADEFIPLNFPEDFNLKFTVNFALDSSNNLYLLQSTGMLFTYMFSYINKNSESYPYVLKNAKPSIIDNNIINIFDLKDFVVLEYSSKISLLSAQNKNLQPVQILNKKIIGDIILKGNDIFIGYLEGGLEKGKLNKETMEVTDFVPVSSFSQKVSIFSLFYGTQNILWVGTDGMGVWKNYKQTSPFSLVETDYQVRSFIELDTNATKILIGTKGKGLKLLDTKTNIINSFDIISGELISNSIYAMERNKFNQIFIGTEGEGLNILNDNKIYKLQFPHKSQIFKSIYAISFTNNDSVAWLGTSGYGLLKVKLKNLSNIYPDVVSVQQFATHPIIDHIEGNINHNIIYSLAHDKEEENIWVGTRGGGLFRFNIKSEKFEKLEKINPSISFASQDILSLQLKKNKLFVGTSFGLNILSIRQDKVLPIKSYNLEQGLANSTIHGILEVNDNNIWVSTNMGLSFINLKNHDILNFTSSDGLQNNEFSDGAYYQDSKKNFYFGGIAGLNYFNPFDFHLRDFVPEIELTDVKIFNTSLDLNKHLQKNVLTLKYDDAHTTLSFVTKDFINNENCKYYYRLKNFSDEWIENGNNPNIVLTKLPPGSYNLEVKSTNGDNIQNENIYNLIVKVNYPWYLQKIAILSYILFFIILVLISVYIINERINLNKKLLLENIEKEHQKKIHESKINFFTNIAHEFFTPLTLIYTPAQYLINKNSLDLNSKRYIQIIKNNAERLQRLIGELMDFRKIESGYATLHFESVRPDNLINNIMDSYTELVEKHEINLIVDSQNNSEIISDISSLEKILFNLISNAFKYTPIGGTIEIVSYIADDKLRFSIKNTGKGLTKSQMDDVFNKFKIFENRSKESDSLERSTGIGLSLVKDLVLLLEGEITVSSELSKNVEFKVIIPSKKINISKETNNINNIMDSTKNIMLEPSLGNHKDISILHKDISILIVEDNKTIRELISDILKPYYNILMASDGSIAYNIIQDEAPDVIISDIIMPNVDGIELLKLLKKNPITQHIPIILISAKGSVEDKITASEDGVDLYITKPFHPKQILAAVQNLINKQMNLKQYYTSSLSSITSIKGKQIYKDEKKFLKELTYYIESNLNDESLSSSKLAEVFGLSKSLLYQKLDLLINKTPNAFIREIRLNYAGQLLTSTNISIQEIMFRTGFANKSYFYREFSKHYGCSPGEYRKNQLHTL